MTFSWNKLDIMVTWLATIFSILVSFNNNTSCIFFVANSVPIFMLRSSKYGTCMAYGVKVKLIDANITPPNRLIMCKATMDRDGSGDNAVREAYHRKLERAYVTAHRYTGTKPKKKVYWDSKVASMCTISALVGLCAGVVISRMASSLKLR